MIKVAAKRALRIAGRLAAADASRRVVVLCYHSIHPSNTFHSATPEVFREHIGWLRQNCNVVPFSQIRAAHTERRTRPTVAITFDDGHEDNHRFALPILKASGVTATFLLTAGLLEEDPEVLGRFQRLRNADYEAIRPLRWTQAKEMLAEGMEIGAHSYSHRNLVRLNASELHHELFDSKRIIEDRLGHPVTMLSYPFGKPRIHFSEMTVAAAKDAGYAGAAAIIARAVRRTDPSFRVPRIYGYGSLESLREKVLGYWDPIGYVQERSPLWLLRIASPTDFAY